MKREGTGTTPAGKDELFAAVEKTRMPMILTDPNQPDDPIIFVNRAFQELSGYAAAELVGRNCRFLQGPGTDPAQVKEIRDAIAAKRDIAIEILNYRRDGTAFVNELFISPVFDTDGRVLYHFGSQLDVTGWRLSRHKLETSEARQRAILDSAVDFAIVVTDRDGHVTDWNTGAERVFGWSAAEMVGQTAERFFTPEDRATDRVGVEMHYALADGSANDERWHLRADGTRFFASGKMMPLRDADGEHLGFIKIVRDRTDEHVAQRTLQETEARLRRAQEAGGVGLFTVDVADDVLTPTPEFCRLYGLPVRDSYPARAFEDLVLREDAGLVSSVEGRRRGESLRDVAYRIRRADTGALRWIGRRAEIEFDDAGRPARMVGVVRDVTEERAAERRRAALLSLGDRFRDLVNVDDVTATASAILGEALDVHLVGYGLVDPAAETITVERDWTAGEASSLAGTLIFRDFGSYIDDLKRGTTVVIEDARTDERTRAFAAALEARHARAFVNTPLFERGSFVALLYVSAGEPRRWSVEELEFIHEVANRTRVATARLIAEAETRAAEAELRLVLNALPLLVAFVDRSMSYRVANAGYRDWFDLDPEQVIGRRMADLLSPEGFAARRPFIERALAGTPARFDLAWPWPDGRRRIAEIQYVPRFDLRGAVDGFYVFVQDVTARRDAEALLTAEKVTLAREVAQRTAERNRLWETTNDLMGMAGFDGFMKSVNPAWTAVLGWTEAQILSRPFAEFIAPADQDETIEVVRRLAAGETITNFVDRVYTRDGETRTMMWTAVPDLDHGAFHVVGRDLTDQRRIEDQLRQSQKMEAVGQLTGGIAHDFNNLLTGITGALDLMERRIGQGRYGDVERFAAIAQGSAKRAAALTHRLLAFSRRQTLDPRPTNPGRLIAGMEDLIRRTVGPSVHVEVVHAVGLWTTLVDPNQLENALLNLCINARDAMPEGGRLTIETANRRLDQHAAGERDLSPGRYVSLCVSDSGTGMPPEVIAKAFDPFFTTKPIGQGTGLGLSMIYGFARQSGGQVRIYSEVGQGTTVCLYLPHHLGEAENGEPQPEIDAVLHAGAGETVLIVDDEAAVRDLALELLRDLGYAAVEAADGASGLKVLQSDARIDLLVTDVGLPGGMNGRQLADAARVTRPGLKVLFITGYAENAVVGNGHLEPGMHVMTKPFALDALASKMRELIGAP